MTSSPKLPHQGEFRKETNETFVDLSEKETDDLNYPTREMDAPKTEVEGARVEYVNKKTGYLIKASREVINFWCDSEDCEEEYALTLQEKQSGVLPRNYSGYENYINGRSKSTKKL